MVVGSKVTQSRQIVPIMELVKKTGRSLLLFSTDLQAEPLSNMLYNHKKGLITSCAVNIPWQNGEELEVLQDIAIITGATYIDNSMIKSMRNVNLNLLGTCNQVRITSSQTNLLGARGSLHKIEKKISQLKEYLETHKDTSLNRKKIILSRISRLSGIVGTIYVGGETETIRNETRDKLIDALNACKAAAEKGILPGGGAALVNASKTVEGRLTFKNMDQKQGARIVLNAVKMPMRIILQNAGLNDAIIINNVIEANDPWIGYNVKKGNAFHSVGKVENMYEAGIWDPLKVIQTYLKDSVSIASLVTSIECIAVRKKDYKRISLY